MAAAEQVIQGILQQIETAWNRYDSISLAAAFAEDANFIQIFGCQLHPNLWGTVGRAGCHRGGAPAQLRDDLQRQPCQFRATKHPLSAPRCRGGIRPSAREVQGRQRGARNRNPPNVDRGKGTGQVANRRVPKYQDLRGASRSPSRGSSCNLVGKLRLALNQQQGPSFKMPMAKRNRALGVVGSVGQGSYNAQS